ncbi:MAG: hypothetical protein K2J20_05330 [Bacilli bacterium]|nr:hypothetical protein [Bacilli bacterium]
MMSDAGMKSGIVNINDFIFKQNLEFYPNLKGLACVDNTIIYQRDGNILNIPLTFDLRTLPGDAWNVTPEEFIDIINLNKKCSKLYKFIELMQTHGYDNFIRPQFIGNEG